MVFEALCVLLALGAVCTSVGATAARRAVRAPWNPTVTQHVELAY